ncbi:hypothetical protein DEO72_LG7g1383 [Vigna unguiculata]|uniref:Uncharacterized protein n=1 Tax=Vigna unguiculata TaxID=3917 RepID=A0A4D6MJC3_VIGUN|nr:hypothetical protein DEO72_LG7g1383 [Vigna unguiculata]
MVVRRRERRGASRGEVARSFAVAAGEDGGAVLIVVDGDDGANGGRWWWRAELLDALRRRFAVAPPLLREWKKMVALSR